MSTGEFTGFLNHQQEIREVDSSGSWRGVALLLLGASAMKMAKVLRLKEGLRRGPRGREEVPGPCKLQFLRVSLLWGINCYKL